MSYEYDAIGNISKVSQGSTVVAEYQYDKLNQLISEKLPQQNLKYTYTYDTSGNIRKVETTNTQTKKILRIQRKNLDIAENIRNVKVLRKNEERRKKKKQR